MKENFSSKAELSQWLRMPPPRRLTPCLRKQLGKTPGSWFLVLFGLLFGGFGSLFCVMFLPWKILQEISLDRAMPRMVAGIVTLRENQQADLQQKCGNQPQVAYPPQRAGAGGMLALVHPAGRGDHDAEHRDQQQRLGG